MAADRNDMPPTLHPVAPIGKRQAGMFVSRAHEHEHDGADCCGFEVMEVDEFPASPNGDKLREMRVRRGIGLRQACDALGLDVVQVSGLERGIYALTPADWNRALNVVATMPVRKST